MRIALLASQGAPANTDMHKVLVLEAYWKFPRFPLLATSSKDLRLVPNRQKPVGPFIA